MTTFNWRVLSPNTLRSYTLAARDFELVTGIPVQNADEVSLAAFRASMEGRKLSTGTIRLRLSAVSVLSGVKVELPQRQKAEGKRMTLSAEQVGSVMAVVTDPNDRMALMQLLTLGTKARTMEVNAETFGAHFAGCNSTMLSAQQASRMIKRYARKAGLDESQVSLRIWCQSGRRLLDSLGAIEFLRMVGAPETSQGVNWKPLHGIGRRSKQAII